MSALSPQEIAALAIAQEKWLDSSSKMTYFKNFRGPLVKEYFVLGNPGVKKILAKNWEFMSRNLFFISAYGRFLLDKTKEQNVIEAETIARNTILNAIKAIQKRIDTAEKSLQKAQINEHAELGRESYLEARLTTPGAALYAELLRKADYYFNLNTVLWIRGEVSDPDKFNNEKEVRSEIQNVVKNISGQFRYILRLVDERDKAEAAKSGAQNEDLAKAEATAVAQVEEIGKDSMLGTVGSSVGSASSETPLAAPAAAPQKASKVRKEATTATA